MHSHYTKNLLNLEDILIKKVIHADHFVEIHIETKAKSQICPSCGKETSRIHDYRTQRIKDLPFQFKHCYLILKKRRYRCTCGKRFSESYSFLPRYNQRTTRLTHAIALNLDKLESVCSIAKRSNVSTATVHRILSTIVPPRPHLPKYLSIDEFRGNAETAKFQCILVDPVKHRILDILPDKNSDHLLKYFLSFPRKERYAVKFFCCDMCQSFTQIAHLLFPNATLIIDRYHFIRLTTYAIENVRKRLQKSMPAKLRKYYKRSHKLILTRYNKLKDESKKECDLMLTYNDELRQAHYLKEKLYEICQNNKYSTQRTDLADWIRIAENSGLEEFQKCARTYRFWFKEILNSLKYKHISNGPTEGFNNKIKVLKRISYGIRNFNHFRSRILLLNNQYNEMENHSSCGIDFL